MSFFKRFLFLNRFWISGLLFVGCSTTPLPIPPTVDSEKIYIDASSETIRVTGDPEAIYPGGLEIRISAESGVDSEPLPVFSELTVDDDGSFETAIGGALGSTVYIESLHPEGERFEMALRPESGDVGQAVEIDPGPDRDNDGSPDAIDCAPNDDTLVGRQCE